MRGERSASRHWRKVIWCMPVVELIRIIERIRPLRPQCIDMTISAGACMRPGEIERHRWITGGRVLLQNRLNSVLWVVWTACIFRAAVRCRDIRNVLALINRRLRRAAEILCDADAKSRLVLDVPRHDRHAVEPACSPGGVRTDRHDRSVRSEERRVGKGCRSGVSLWHV